MIMLCVPLVCKHVYKLIFYLYVKCPTLCVPVLCYATLDLDELSKRLGLLSSVTFPTYFQTTIIILLEQVWNSLCRSNFGYYWILRLVRLTYSLSLVREKARSRFARESPDLNLLYGMQIWDDLSQLWRHRVLPLWWVYHTLYCHSQSRRKSRFKPKTIETGGVYKRF